METRTKILGLEPIKGRWFYLIFGMIINICLGSVYSWSVFRRPIEEHLDVTAAQSGTPYMFFLFFFALLMPFAGRFIEKLGAKTVILVGGITVALGWLLSTFTTGIITLTLTYGVIAGSGVGIVYGAPIALITRWFPDKKGLAVGLVLTGFGLSPFVTAPLARHLIEAYNVMATFGILGAIFLIVIVLLALPLKGAPPQWAESFEEKAGDKKTIKPKDVLTKEMLRSKSFYALWICYIFGTLCGLMAIGISEPVGVEIIELSPAVAAGLVSLFAVFNGVGRPFFGWFTDLKGYRTASIFSFIMILLASLGMLTAGSGNTILYVICFSIFWLNLGGWLAIAPTATASLFGLKYYAQNYGIIYTAYGIGALIGTYSSGHIRDIFGQYTNAFWLTTVCAVLGIIVSLTLLNKKEAN